MVEKVTKKDLIQKYQMVHFSKKEFENSVYLYDYLMFFENEKELNDYLLEKCDMQLAALETLSDIENNWSSITNNKDVISFFQKLDENKIGYKFYVLLDKTGVTNMGTTFTGRFKVFAYPVLRTQKEKNDWRKAND